MIITKDEHIQTIKNIIDLLYMDNYDENKLNEYFDEVSTFHKIHNPNYKGILDKNKIIESFKELKSLNIDKKTVEDFIINISLIYDSNASESEKTTQILKNIWHFEKSI